MKKDIEVRKHSRKTQSGRTTVRRHNRRLNKQAERELNVRTDNKKDFDTPSNIRQVSYYNKDYDFVISRAMDDLYLEVANYNDEDYKDDAWKMFVISDRVDNWKHHSNEDIAKYLLQNDVPFIREFIRKAFFKNKS